MIPCVWFSDIEAYLASQGYRLAGSTEENLLFESEGGLLIIRKPNVHGYLPEILVDDVLCEAGLVPPAWNVFFGD